MLDCLISQSIYRKSCFPDLEFCLVILCNFLFSLAGTKFLSIQIHFFLESYYIYKIANIWYAIMFSHFYRKNFPQRVSRRFSLLPSFSRISQYHRHFSKITVTAFLTSVDDPSQQKILLLESSRRQGSPEYRFLRWHGLLVVREIRSPGAGNFLARWRPCSSQFPGLG